MKLIDALKTIGKGVPKNAETFRVGLVCGFTPLHLQTFLHAQLQLLLPSRRIEFRSGHFGDVPGSIEAMKSENLDAVAIVLEWSDIDARLGIRQLGGWGPKNLASIVEHAQVRLTQIRKLLEDVTVPVALSGPTLPLPPLFFTAGWQSGNAELKLSELVSAFLSSTAEVRNIRIVNERTLDRMSPLAERLNAKSDWMAGFPYQNGHASVLASLIARVIRDPLPKKGLITDLDNTLWSGVLGDVGVEAVCWDLDHHAQAHGLYQQMLRTLSEEGVLVAVASKNDPAIVERAFQRNDLLIAKQHVFPFAVSWGTKAKAISNILTTWNIAPDSVVFVDDSPLELAEVKAAHPDIECLQFQPDDPQAVYDLLVKLRDLFGKSRVSDEDSLRLDSIRASAIFQEGNDTDGFSDTLLETAQAEVTLNFRKDLTDTRAFELINKTNQFNLNGKRFTEAAWAEYLGRPDTFLVTASYKDRFGGLGKISVIAGRTEDSKLVVDSWVLSCRAFARRIEHLSLQTLFDRYNAERICLAYLPTERNGPLTSFLAEILAGDPKDNTVLAKDEFRSRCPKLFHTVTFEN